MKRKDWTEQLRDRLDGYELQPPERLWEDIESAMEPSSNRRPAVFRWWAVAASIILLLSGGAGFLFLMQDSSQPTDVSKGNMDKEHRSEPKWNHLGSIEPTPKQDYSYAENTYQWNAIPMTEKLAMELVTVADNHDLAVENDSIEVVEHVAATEDPAPISAQQFSSKPSATVVTPQERSVRNSPMTVPECSHSHRDVAVSLYASNLGSPSSQGFLVSQPVVMAPRYMGMNAQSFLSNQAPETAYLSSYEEKTEHLLPLSLGLTARWQLTSRWSVESGLVYTLAKSSFIHSSRTFSVKEKQALHNVGIPLTVNYSFWNRGSFSAYLSAGGEVDWNVKTTWTTDGQTTDGPKDRPQWSMGLGVGAQYDFLPQLGIYVEPSAHYYFDNHSSVETIFKEEPTVWNLRVGLRWNIY